MTNYPTNCEKLQDSSVLKAQEILAKRYRSINDFSLTPEHKNLAYGWNTFDLLELYAKHPGLRDQVENTSFDSKEAPLDDKLVDHYSNKLVEIFDDEYYGIVPGMVIENCAKDIHTESGQNYSMEIVGVEDNGPTSYEYKFYLTDKNSGRELMGVIFISYDYSEDGSKKSQIHVELKPANLMRDGRIPQYVSPKSDKVKALIGLTYLVRVPEFESRTYNGQRLENNNQNSNNEPMPIDVSDDVKVTTLPYRRTTVRTVQEAYDKVEDFVARTQDDILQKVKEELGDIEFEVRAVERAGANAKFVGTCKMIRTQIEEQVRKALDIGNTALFTYRGAYLLRELDNLPFTKGRKPHLRRVRKKDGHYVRSDLVLGQEGKNYPGIKALYDKYRKNEPLTPEESEELERFMTKFNIDDYDQGPDMTEVPKVIRTDGKALYGHQHGGGSLKQRYVIKKLRRVA